MKIKIIVPINPKKEEWFITANYRKKKLANAITLLAYVKGKLSATSEAGESHKTHVIVIYDQLHGLRLRSKYEWFNDVESRSSKDILYALASFLEDYLSHKSLASIRRKYL